jgi:hypothetical protein
MTAVRTIAIETYPSCADFGQRALVDSRDRFGEISELVFSPEDAVRLATQEGGVPKVVIYCTLPGYGLSEDERKKIARFYAVDPKRVEVRVLPGALRTTPAEVLKTSTTSAEIGTKSGPKQPSRKSRKDRSNRK